MRLPVLVCICLCVEGMMMAAWSGEYRVPLSAKPPKIDGKFDPVEWAASAGFEGFVRLADGKLERRRARGFVAADEENIYVAILSQLPDEGALSATVAVDSLKAVYDDSVEVYICPTPDAPDRVDYQFLVNSLGKGGYNIHKTGNPAEDVSWQGKWKSAHGQADGWWVCECAIPIASMGTVAKGRKTTDGVWTVNLTRNWKPDWGWTSLSGGYPNSGLRFIFTKEPAPSVRHECEGDIFLLPAVHRLVVANPGKQPLSLKAQMILVRNNMPEIKEEKAIDLAPGGNGEVQIALAENDPTTQFDLALRVISADGQKVFYDRLVKWPRAKEPYRYVCGKPKDAPPVDFKFAYYPSKNKLRVLADVNGLPKDARLTELVGQIRTQAEKTVMKTIVIAAAEFKGGRCEKSFDLPPLEGFFEIAFRAEG
ncbi:MAG: hypothetical protein N3A66_04790, partial [Planctomycetota bacterium]|nr:hypothetical protein [Planctomycetota bacterium]